MATGLIVIASVVVMPVAIGYLYALKRGAHFQPGYDRIA